MTHQEDGMDCAHVLVETFGDGENGPSLWACADCRLRFYPACRTCVDVGHRNIEHTDPTPATPSSEERDALAANLERMPSHFATGISDQAGGYDDDDRQCAECAEDWPCPTSRLIETATAILAATPDGAGRSPIDVDVLARALEAALPCEDPEEDCDADGRDEHRWCDLCVARAVTMTHVNAVAAEYARLSEPTGSEEER